MPVMSASKICAVFSSLLLLWVAWTSGDMVMPRMSVRGRCHCVNYADSVSVRRIVNITVLEPDSFCSKTQIILTLKREACLNPDSEQGGKLRECWRSHDMNVVKTKVCLRRKKTH